MRTISSPQNAFGIQISQNVTANEDTNKEATSSLHPAHRGISVITPLPSGEGKGEGPAGVRGGATRGRGSAHPHKPKKLPPERMTALFRYNEYSHEGELH